MEFRIKHKKHYLTRFPLGLLLIVVFAVLPVLVGFLGAWVTEQTTGQPCHEGNCIWMVLPWLGMITLPVGGIALLAYLVLVLVDSIALIKNSKG